MMIDQVKPGITTHPIFYEMDIQDIRHNEKSYRKEYPPEDIEDLAKSIQTIGLLHPILIKKSGDKYLVISGERRLYAYEWLYHKYGEEYRKIPSRIIESDRDMGIYALSENIHRYDLTPLEEAGAVYDLLKNTRLTYEQLGHHLGKSESYVENRMRYFRIFHGLLSRIKMFKVKGDFIKRLGKLPISKMLPLKTLISHWGEKETYDFLMEITDHDLSLKTIKDTLQIHYEQQLNRRILHLAEEDQNPIELENDESFDDSQEIIIDQFIEKRKKPLIIKENPIETIRRTKDHPDSNWSNEFWLKLIELIRDSLQIRFRRILDFQKAFEHLVDRYGEPIQLG